MSPVSMMPAGLTASLREDEFVDLVRFLSELGREGDYKIRPTRYVRSWMGMGQMDQAQIDQVRHVGLPVLNDPDHVFPWQPITTRVSGELPLAELPVAQRLAPLHPRIARFQLRLAAAGQVKLALSTVKGVVIVVGDRQIQELEQELALDLPAGSTWISTLVTREAADLDGFSVEIVEGAGEVVP
jgi:hypothetical protein